MSTTAFVPPTLNKQFVVVGKTLAPFTGLTITSDEPITSTGIIATTLIPSDPTITDVGKITDSTGAGAQVPPNSFEEFNTIGSVSQTTMIQRLVYTPPTLKNGQSIQVDTFPETATSLTPGGALDSNIAFITPALIDVVTPPDITGTVANQPVGAPGTINPFSTVTITDTDFLATAKDTASIIITDGGKATDDDGLMTGGGLSKTGVGTYSIANPTDPTTLTFELQNLTLTAPSHFGTHTAAFELDVTDVPPAGETTTPGVDTKVALTTKDTTTSVMEIGQIPPPPTTNFHITDVSTGVTDDTPGVPFTGPVPGIKNQLIVQDPFVTVAGKASSDIFPTITKDNLNITAVTPNVFIHSGSGTDALDVSAVNGTNVLDGSTGSNFLVGGTGTGSDTFFLDDRNAPADIFSTVRNLHSGDAITVFGVTKADFTIKAGDNVLPGVPGLDIAITAPGKANANVDIPNYAVADLSNGRLVQSFGTEADGTPFMFLQAT